MNTTTETPWAHLPNAVHIKRIIDSVEANPDAWQAVYIEVYGEAVNNAARNAAWDVAMKTARGVAWDAARDAIWFVTRDTEGGGRLGVLHGMLRGMQQERMLYWH
jgi:hypothetical protein